MKIFAIDPGTAKSAWMEFDTDGLVPVRFGISDNEEVLVLLHQNRQCEHLAIEMVASFGMPVGKEVFETCVWIGRFIQQAKLPFTCLYRKEIVIHLCGTAKAKDGNVRQALIDRYGPQGTKKSPGATYGISKDVWSSLAIATTWTDTYKE